ncbi:energy-coupling factor transport system permease protein [Ruminococcus sp. YRD2003]|uniref:energy-coupling factor transporter transmembrane component T n=1 Tax=Ruminococcus sp. YRD2003 TaxID=1452313 RepID=UPI0008D1F424|nr:energy-coupling factor transport system permease protein [Ruminococcus flavefaciens]
MRRFEEFDPVAVTVWFFSVTGVAMFCGHPLLMAISLAGAVLFFVVRNGTKHGRSHLFFVLLFAVLALANPLISHNGATVLFVVNDRPVTLEALLYGVNSAAVIVGVLYWFRSLTQIMTSEKVLCVAGTVSPKLALVMSMALRSVPMFARRAKQVSDSQKAMGLYSEDNIIDDIRGRMRVFSIISTWALENGIVTADSMAARGYGTGRRSQLRRFRFTAADAVLMLVTLALLAVTAAAIAADSLAFTFYPRIDINVNGTLGICGAAAYGVLVLLPIFIETEVSLRWRYLQSKI